MKDLVAAAGARLGWTPAQAWTALPGLALSAPVLIATVVGVLGQPAPERFSVPDLPGVAVPADPVPAAQVPAALPVPLPEIPSAVALPSEVGSAGLLPGLLPPVAPVPLPAPFGAPPSPRAAPAPSAAPADLTISDSGWSSQLGADPTVPGGTLPVQAGPTGEVARSFLRLSAPAPRLRLLLDETPGATYGREVAGVRACQNVDPGWLSGGGQPPAAAPEVDPMRCVVGVRDGDGYSFDLTTLPDPAGAGISLLPDPAGPAPYRLVFRTLLEDA